MSGFILASKSASRRAMLTGAGMQFDPVPADIDERALEASLEDAAPSVVAEALSSAKAEAVSRQHPERLVVGSDSLVSVEGRRFDKPDSREQAAEHLSFFSGKVMELHSGAALARGGQAIWSHSDVARLQVRALDAAFIEAYLAREWPEVSHCVGVFRIEALGPHLFERIEGDYFTVLGMPLLPLLGALRREGIGL